MPVVTAKFRRQENRTETAEKTFIQDSSVPVKLVHILAKSSNTRLIKNLINSTEGNKPALYAPVLKEKNIVLRTVRFHRKLLKSINYNVLNMN